MSAFTITSETYSTRSSLRSLFGFLSDFKNFQSVLPEDRVTDFKYTENECSFNIKGITPMTVRFEQKVPYEYILFATDNMGKFNFNLKAVFIGDGGTAGQCRIDLSGDMNPFIKAMAEKPLTGLVNTMSNRLSQLILEDAD